MAKYDFDFKKKVVLAYLKGKCHERPENQTAKAWLNENGIDVKQYYYWQKELGIHEYHQRRRSQRSDIFSCGNSQGQSSKCLLLC